MKKILVLAAAIAMTAGVAYAQKNKVTTAYMAHKNYKTDKDPFNLNKAKTNIDDASVHPDTKDDSKTWYYRGDIYLSLFNADYNATLNSITNVDDMGKKRSMAYVQVPTANLIEATNSYLKAKNLDKVGAYAEGIAQGLQDAYGHDQNVGIANYNQQKYAEALPMFELANTISVANGITDTVMINNCASSALNAKMYDKAITHFKKLTEIGWGKGNTWLLLAECYQSKSDSVNYKATIASGVKKYPMDAGLLSHDVDIKLKEGKKAEAVATLESLTASKPNDPEMFFIVGNVYDQMANPTGADGKPAAKPSNYEELHEKAAQNYKKAVELKADYFDALYNLGILYYNQGVEYYNRSMSTIADAAKYNALWEPPLKIAIEYLEKARTIDPKDLNTLMALRTCYGQIGDSDNYDKMKEEIKKVQGQ